MDDAVAELAANGLRVIAVAHRQLTAQQAQSVVDDPDEIARLCRDELSLVGFLGLSDTPAPRRRPYLRTCTSTIWISG